MTQLSPDEVKRKKEIFDAMSQRSKARILKKGYDAWNPFEQPNDPIDLRMQRTMQIAHALIAQFSKENNMEKRSAEYQKGVWDICLGLIDKKDLYGGMYDFCAWYHNATKKRKSQSTL